MGDIGDALHELPHLFDSGMLAKDRPHGELLLAPLFEGGSFFAKRALLEGPAQEGSQLVDVDRLGQVLVGAGFEGLDGGVYLGMSGENEDR